MKTLKSLLWVVIAMVLVSCDGPKPGVEPVVKESANYDLAIMDGGRLVLYDIANQKAMPVEAEQDSLFNCVFTDDGFVFYSVKRGDETYLKYVDLSDDALQPQLAAAWDLPWNLCCGTEYYCRIAPNLDYYPEQKVVGMAHMMEPNYGFSDYKIFDRNSGQAVSPWVWDGDPSFLENPEWHSDYDEDLFMDVEEERMLYYGNNGKAVCLTDQLEFDIAPEDAEYFPIFEVMSVDPSNKYVLFEVLTHEESDMEFHGPQCVASLDGSFQRVLGDFDGSYPGQWMGDGILVYGAQGIHRLNLADGSDILLYPNTCVFVKR